MADFLINAGVVFSPKDVDTEAIQTAIAKSIANTTIKLSKFSLSKKELKSTIQTALDGLSLKLTIGKVKLNQGAIEAEVSAAIQNATKKAAKVKVDGDAATIKKFFDNLEQKAKDSLKRGSAKALAETGKIPQGTQAPGTATPQQKGAAGAQAKEVQTLSQAYNQLLVKSQQVEAIQKQVAADMQRSGNAFSASTRQALINASAQESVAKAGTRSSAGIKEYTTSIDKAVSAAKRLSQADLAKREQTQEIKIQADRLRRLADAYKAKQEKLQYEGRQIDAITKSQTNLNALYAQGGLNLEGFGAKIGQVINRFSAYLVSIKLVLIAQRAFNATVASIRDFDDAILELAKVTDTSTQSLAQLSEGMIQVGRETGRSFTELAKSMNEIVRLGLSGEEALTRLKDVMLLVNVTELGVSEATNFMTSTWNIFQDQLVSGTQAIDILSKVSDSTAASATELAQALTRSAAAAKAVGVSYRQLTALTAATVAQTKISANTIGQSFKTIFTRLTKNSTAIRNQVNAWGANVTAADSVYEVLGKIAGIYGVLNKEQRSQLSYMVAGTRRFTELTGLLQSYGAAQDLVTESFDSAGEAERKNAIELQKFSSIIKVVKNNFIEFIAALTGTDQGTESASLLKTIFMDVANIINGITTTMTTVLRTINESATLTFLMSGAFKGIAKGAFFTIGLYVIKQMVIGFSTMLQLGAHLKALLAGKVQTLVAANVEIAKEQQGERLVLGVEKERVGVLQRIKMLAGQAAEKLKAAAASRGRIGMLGRGALADPSIRSMIGATALFTAIQYASDGLSKLGDAVKESGGAVAQIAGGMIQATGNAAQMGAMFGFLAGSPMVGFGAGLTLLAYQSVMLAYEWLKIRGQQADFVKEVQEMQYTTEDVADSGIYLKTAFEQLGGNITGNANKLETLSRAFGLALNEVTGLPAAISRASETYINTTRQIEGAMRAADIQRTINEFNKGFKQRAEEIQLKIDAGDVASEFEPVSKAIAKMNAEVRSQNPELLDQVDILDRIRRAYAANKDLLQETGDTTEQIIKSHQLQSLVTQDLEDNFKNVTVELKKELAELDKVRDGLDEVNKKSEEFVKLGQKANKLGQTDADDTDNVLDIGNQITANEQKKLTLIEKRQSLEDKIGKLQGNLAKIEQARTKAYEDDAKNIQEQINSWEAVKNEIMLSVAAVRLKNDEMRRSFEIAKAEANAQAAANRIRRQPGGAAREARAELEEYRQEIQRTLEQREKKELQTIANITAARDMAAKAGLDSDVALLNKELELAKAAFKEERGTILEDLRIRFIPKIEEAAQKGIEAQEKELAARRVEQVQRAVEAESRLAQRRQSFIEEFGKTPLGFKVLEGELRSLGQYARKVFGNTGALMVNELQKAANLGTQAVIKEMIAGYTANMSAEDKLQKLQEAKSRVLLINEELLGQTREQLLKRVKEVSERVAESESRLVDARNKIPELNAKVIESERNLGAAVSSVEEATMALMTAFQAAADATAQYRYGLAKAAYDVKVTTGALDGPGAKMRELANIYDSVTSQIKLSQESLLDLQKNIADEMLSIYQEQFNTIKNLGIQVATASDDQMIKIAEGLAAASEIMSGADLGGFSSEELASALQFKDLFAGLETKIAEFGLEQLGVDSAVLKDIESEMLELAKISAESGKQQVNASYQQVATAQANLAKAEEAYKQAQEHLQVSKEQRQYQINTVQQLGVQYALQRAGYIEAQKVAAREINIMNDSLAQTKEINMTLKAIEAGISAQTSAIASANKTLEDARANPGASIPNRAGGSLSNSEIRGLISSAQREKALMPAGSNLMLANTSEVVLTRNQAKMFGLQPSAKKFAAEGNAQAAGLENAAVSLNSAINALLNKLNSPGFVEQNISIKVDSERKVNVTGLDAIEGTVKRAMEEKLGGIPSKAEQDTINKAVVHIVEKLQEMGVVNSIGD